MDVNVRVGGWMCDFKFNLLRESHSHSQQKSLVFIDIFHCLWIKKINPIRSWVTMRDICFIIVVVAHKKLYYKIEMDYRMASIDDDKIVFSLMYPSLTHSYILSSNWNDMDFSLSHSPIWRLWWRQWLESGFRDFSITSSLSLTRSSSYTLCLLFLANGTSRHIIRQHHHHSLFFSIIISKHFSKKKYITNFRTTFFFKCCLSFPSIAFFTQK